MSKVVTYIGEDTLTRGDYGERVEKGVRCSYVGHESNANIGTETFHTNGGTWAADPNGKDVAVWDSTFGWMIWNYNVFEWE